MLSQNIMFSMLLYFNFLSESKWQIWDPIGRWGEEGGGLAPLDLSVREGDRKNQFAMRLNCA